MTVTVVILELGLLQEGSLWTLTRVEMWPSQIMGTKTSSHGLHLGAVR